MFEYFAPLLKWRISLLVNNTVAHNVPTRMLSVTRELFRATFFHYGRVPKTTADLNMGLMCPWVGSDLVRLGCAGYVAKCRRIFFATELRKT